MRKDYFRVINYRDLHFNDFGDRVAQLLHVELVAPFSQSRNGEHQQEILIVNTHLLFPHDSSLCLVRLHQVKEFSLHSFFGYVLISVAYGTVLQVLDYHMNDMILSRFTKFCNMLNLFRKNTISIPFPSFFAGNFIVSVLLLGSFPAVLEINLFAFANMHIISVTGMGVNVGKFTNSSDHRVLCHHMIQLISILMQMRTRSFIFTV